MTAIPGRVGVFPRRVGPPGGDVRRGPISEETSTREGEPNVATPFLVHSSFVSALIFGAFAILLLAAASFYASRSGAVRWILLASVLMAVAYVAVRYAAARSRDPVPLDVLAATAAGTGGGLRSLRRTLERADRGLVYSQAVFEERMRKAFLGKVRSNRHLTVSALDAASDDPKRLGEIVQNPNLTEFVLEAARDIQKDPTRASPLPKNEFAKRSSRTLDAMEAWR